MENASKALIIAGAIILAVLIIGLGMAVFMQTSNVDSTSQIDQFEVQQFNDQFTKYAGPSVKGSRVLTLCEVVRQHNAQNKDDVTRQVYIDEGDDFTDNQNSGKAGSDGGEDSEKYIQSAVNMKSKIKSGKTYSVTVQYDQYSNLVCAIHVRDLAGK